MAVKQYTLYDIGGGSGESLYVTTLLLVVIVIVIVINCFICMTASFYSIAKACI